MTLPLGPKAPQATELLTEPRLESLAKMDLRNLASVQEHWSMEGRAIIREANVDYYSKKEDFAQHMGAESSFAHDMGKGSRFQRHLQVSDDAAWKFSIRAS